MYSVIYLALGIVFLSKRSRYYCYLKKYQNFKISKCLTCKMKLLIIIALTKTVSFTFNLFFITVIIIVIYLILTLIFSLVFSCIIWHLNFDCHPSQTVQPQQDNFSSNTLAHILAKVFFPCTRTLVVAHLLVGQLGNIISIMDWCRLEGGRIGQSSPWTFFQPYSTGFPIRSLMAW